MRDAKNRKHEKKRVNKALANKKTEESRQRRLDNKAKREAINAIDPDIKVILVDQVPYERCGKTTTTIGREIEVRGKKLHFITNNLVDILEDADPYINDVKAEILDIAEKTGMEVEPVVEVLNVDTQETKIVETTNFNKLKSIFKKW